MFKVHKDGMRMEPTPERVYSICRYVAYQSCTRSDLQNVVSMFSGVSNSSSDPIGASTRVAEELGLLENRDGVITFVGDGECLRTYIDFRRFVSNRVYKQKNTTFFKVTQWYLSKNEEIFELDTWEDKAAAVVNDGIDGVSENDFLGWRFWAGFLGEGYLYDRLLIPNMKIRLQDVLCSMFKQDFAFDTEIAAMEFLSWLKEQIPETSVTADAPLSLGLSNGMRTLAELGFISMRSQMDALKVRLHPIEGEELNDFSHITVKEVVIGEMGQI